MKLSDKPTRYLMIEAITHSEDDCCDFAIIHLTDEWLAKQNNRLITEHTSISYRSYSDCSVNFYMDDSDVVSDSFGLLKGKSYSFVELEPNEQELFSIPQEQLVSHTLSISRDGYAYYYAQGIDTGEDFWTKEFSLTQILESVCI